MNILDRTISFLAPTAGVRRMEARASLQAAQAKSDRVGLINSESSVAREMRETIARGQELHARLYNISQHDPNIDPRSYQVGNATEDVIGAIDNAKRLVRDRMMNDPLAIRAREIRVDAIHGEGIMPRCDSRNRNPTRKDAIDTQVMDLYYDHFESQDCDVNGVFDLFGLTIMAESTKACDGEVLWIDVWNSRTDTIRKGLSHPLQFDVRECDWLAWNVKSYEDRGVVYPVIGGIEFDPRTKRRRAYHLFTQDPAKGVSETVRIDARYVVHDADVGRLQQFRGWSIFAPVVPVFHDLNDADDAGLKRAKVDAAMGVLLEVPDGSTEEETSVGTPGGGFGYGAGSTLVNGRLAPDGTAGGAPISFVQSGMMARMRKGTIPHVIQPQASSVFEPVQANAKRRIAMAVSQTYEAISGDYSKVSYISGRLAKGPVNRAMRRLQWQWIVRRGNKLWRDFITGCSTMDAWGFEGYFGFETVTWKEVSWTLPIPDSADPKLEAEVEAMQLKSGRLIHSEMIRRAGGDSAQHYRQMRQAYDQAAEVGIDLDRFIFSGDGGKTASDSGKLDPEDDPNDPNAVQDGDEQEGEADDGDDGDEA
jgi:lambda family phage portal protein